VFQTSESCIKLHAVVVLELLLSEQCVCVSTAPGVCVCVCVCAWMGQIQRTHFTAGYTLYNCVCDIKILLLLQSFKSESASCIKLLCLKRKSFLIPVWRQHDTLAYCRPLVDLFMLVRMKVQIHSLPLGAAFGALKIAVSRQRCTQSSTALSGITGMMQWKWDQSTNHRWLVWKNKSLKESFGSRWANKVKIN